MKNILKIQFISRDLPVESGGGTSVYRLSLLRYLRSIGCRIEYLLLHYKGEEDKQSHKTSSTFNDLFKVISMEQSDPEKYPVWSDIPTSQEKAFLRAEVKRGKPDVLIIDHPWLCGLLDQIDKKNLITAVLTHDVQYKKIKDFKKYGVNPYKRNNGYKQPYWSKELERSLLSNVDIILAIQKEDFRIFQRMLPSKQIDYLPVAVETRANSDIKETKGRCLFVGGSAQHNAFGLKWFLSEVWPLVLKENPTATLHVCGEVYKGIDIKSYTYQSKVIFRGKVKDLHTEYNQAQVCVIPLKVGSGLKIKLVEAMAYGKACVSTTVGIQGIEDVVNYGVIVADEPTNFANAIIELFKYDSKRSFLEDMNRHYAKTHFSPTAAYGPFVLDVMSKLKTKFNQ